MKTEELKLWVIEKILRTEDEQLLLEVRSLLKEAGFSSEEKLGLVREPMIQYGNPETETYRLSEAERAAIEEARAQFARGEVLTAEEAERDIKEWVRD
jgi:hypothetical protein